MTFAALFVALALQPGDGSEQALRRRVAAQPPAVRAFFERRANCNHWAGEEPYDRARRREIESALEELGCGTIDGEEKFLRRHFARSPETLAVIDLAAEQAGW